MQSASLDNDLFETRDDDNDPLIDSVSRTAPQPDNTSSSPSTTSQSVRSLTLSPEDERRIRTSTSSSNNSPSVQRRVNDNSAAALLVQQLTSSTAFYDIPMNDPFSELVERYIPPDQRPQREMYPAEEDQVPNMVMSNMWRSVARFARQQLVVNKTMDIERILQLWYLRLLALCKLGLYQLASAELDKLGDLNRPELTYEFHGMDGSSGSLVPFELFILWARLPAWLKHPLISLERLTMLAVQCKKKGWKQRQVQVYLVLATQFIEINDYASAASTMDMVRKHFDAENNVDILSALGRLYLQLGDVERAEKMYSQIEQRQEKTPAIEEMIKVNRAFLCIAKGEWSQAAEILQAVLQANKDNLLAMNNLAVCQVYLGQLGSALDLLSIMTTDNPTSAGTCATALMNICTLFELRYDSATEKKVELMKQVSRWVGDSFQVDCLKLQ
ncbi:hypothetical protein O0I10_008030 [Lichtheimia ornata]|uniref:Trafficking protein particle complex subunit 12 n=1 Tax=Lichtheimia ornata TaxID=688661 RepID=A0AAD7V0F6_9FUNG|nr:uncharacterized protein O0I10_008030 [Lichtheimia ornata]KAJ8656236.1 hypothetical protein O0I10_008030 [Lichtheimia ornata]